MLTLLLVQSYLLTRSRKEEHSHDHVDKSHTSQVSKKEDYNNSKKLSSPSLRTEHNYFASCNNWLWSFLGYYWPTNSFLYESKSVEKSPPGIKCLRNQNNNYIILQSVQSWMSDLSMPISSEKEVAIQTFPPPRPNSNNMSLEDKFKAAVKVIHSLPKDGPYQPSNGTKLKFYGLFKQATEGTCNIPKPNFWDVVGKYKWEAWHDLGQLTKEEAMLKYIEGLKEIIETMSWDGNVQDFLDSIGPFYEFVNLQGSEMSHVKETIDRLTSSGSSSSSSGSGSGSNSSSGSSSAISSIVPTPINSCPNSPLKSVTDNESSSTSGTTMIENNTEARAQVQVEARTATYETNQIATNGNGSSSSLYTNGFHHHHAILPTPQHTYRKLSIPLSPREINEMDDKQQHNDEMIAITLPNTNGAGNITCQEDLEKDPDQEQELPLIENTAAAATTTSGTESEKYYSGDSEPDFDDKFNGYHNFPPAVAGHSRNFLLGQSSFHDKGSTRVVTRGMSTSPPPTSTVGTSSSSLKKSSVVSFSNGNGTSRNRKSSPKSSVGLDGLLSSDVILSSTVDRLNRDVDHIMARLRILETAYAASVSNGGGGGDDGMMMTERGRRGRRGPSFFGNMSYSAIAFLLMWPFAVHFLLKAMTWWWARRRKILTGLVVASTKKSNLSLQQ